MHCILSILWFSFAMAPCPSSCMLLLFVVTGNIVSIYFVLYSISRDIQKATQNFTTILGQGSFGPVYKAIMPTSEVVAVKVLANNSRQGEREFQTEVCFVLFGLMLVPKLRFYLSELVFEFLICIRAAK